MKLKINREEGFIVQILFVFFYMAEKISIFYWFRKMMNAIWIRKHKDEILKDKDGTICQNLKMPIGKSYILPEIWAIGNVFWALLWFSLITKKIITVKWLIWIILILSFIRVWELIIYQINVLFFHRLNSKYITKKEKETDNSKAWAKYNRLHKSNKTDDYVIKSATRTVLLLIINMIEYVLQFSLMYNAVILISGGALEMSSILASFEIFMNMSKIEDLMGSSSIYLARIGEIETLTGMFMNIICLARFIGMLPEVAQLDNK